MLRCSVCGVRKLKSDRGIKSNPEVEDVHNGPRHIASWDGLANAFLASAFTVSRVAPMPGAILRVPYGSRGIWRQEDGFGSAIPVLLEIFVIAALGTSSLRR
jgi:hypothetical protein